MSKIQEFVEAHLPEDSTEAQELLNSSTSNAIAEQAVAEKWEGHEAFTMVEIAEGVEEHRANLGARI